MNTTAMQGTVNKTLLDEGCPLKYYLKWKSKDTLNMQIKEFSVGKMPVSIWFTINCECMKFKPWEKDEYIGNGWIKLQGTGGYEDGDSGSVQGYLNVKTKEIEFITNFNVMNMSPDGYLQNLNLHAWTDSKKNLSSMKKTLQNTRKNMGFLDFRTISTKGEKMSSRMSIFPLFAGT